MSLQNFLLVLIVTTSFYILSYKTVSHYIKNDCQTQKTQAIHPVSVIGRSERTTF